MNNDINRNHKDEDVRQESQVVNSQQFTPGGRQPQRGNDQRTVPPRGGQQQPMRGMPTTPPPSFTPQLRDDDGMERSFGIDGRGRDGRDGRGRRNPERELRRCLFRFTYVWLVNGNGFWFFPISVDRQSVQGFRWRRPGWRYDRINLRRIFDAQCF